MNRSWGLLASAWIAVSCGGDDSFAFAPPTDAQLQAVQAIWSERDLAARDVVLVHQDDDHPAYQVRIYEHRVEGRRHYGAITIPKSETRTSFPVVLYADGLDQSLPAMDVGAWMQGGAQYVLDQAVFAIPVFRGRSLIYGDLSFDAEGDFCDAYDGATDDAIGLLNVVAAEISEADFSRLMARGQSRGGNVALLLAERDARVTVAAAQAAPTDFYRQEVADHYPAQYRCQFLTGKTEAQARERMLASSPLHFPIQPSVTTVYIDHGEQDSVVPIWNAQEMVSALEASGVDVRYHSYPGYGHTDLDSSPDFISNRSAVYQSFLGQ